MEVVIREEVLRRLDGEKNYVGRKDVHVSKGGWFEESLARRIGNDEISSF